MVVKWWLNGGSLLMMVMMAMIFNYWRQATSLQAFSRCFCVCDVKVYLPQLMFIRFEAFSFLLLRLLFPSYILLKPARKRFRLRSFFPFFLADNLCTPSHTLISACQGA